MKRLLLFSLVLLSGCSVINKIHPNLATRLVKDYPRLQDICDHVGGCQNVKIICTRYDNYGDSDIRNMTFWEVSTGEGTFSSGNYVSGTGMEYNDHLDTKRTINSAISDYWGTLRIESTLTHSTVYPNSTDCEKDCGVK